MYSLDLRHFKTRNVKHRVATSFFSQNNPLGKCSMLVYLTVLESTHILVFFCKCLRFLASETANLRKFMFAPFPAYAFLPTIPGYTWLIEKYIPHTRQ